MPTFVANAPPLTGETRFGEPGMALWFPPRSPFSGPGPRVRAVVDALRRGGRPARTHPDVSSAVGFPTTIGALAGGPPLALGARAGREAAAIVRQDAGGAGIGTHAAARVAGSARLVRLGSWEQTRLNVSSFIARGRAASLPVEALEALSSSVPRMAESAGGSA